LPATFSGDTLGSTCGSLVFEEGGPSFTTATPPYNGTFAPHGSSIDGQSTDGVNGASYTLYVHSYVAGGFTLNCWRMELTVGP
jgi:hypothetical protein